MQFTKRITKIIDEITTYFIGRMSKELDISIKLFDDRISLEFVIFDFEISKSELRDIEDSLKIPRQTDAEEFYWQLNGSSESEREFDLVGMMIDDYSIDVSEKEFRLTLVRKI